MKNLSLYSAFAVIAIANTSALVHAALNRTGTPTSQLTLTNRELSYYASSASDDDSEVSLHLRWISPVNTDRYEWLDRQSLQRLGFDCSVDPNSDRAERFYQRQRPRRAFIALEYDGPAWAAWLDDYHRQLAKTKTPPPVDDSKEQSHLLPVDVDLSPTSLRARHPNRSQVLIIPAIIFMRLTGVHATGESAMQITGYVREAQSSIHVPLPFSDMFRRNFPKNQRHESEAGYTVHLRYGSAYEPSIESVEFTR